MIVYITVLYEFMELIVWCGTGTAYRSGTPEITPGV
jgi:hypothetical protein